jgi:hypothetical protein
MGDVVVETVYTFPYVFVGVGESVVARKVIPHSFLIERLTVVMPGPRLSRWLRADDLNHVEIESLKIGSRIALTAATAVPESRRAPGERVLIAAASAASQLVEAVDVALPRCLGEDVLEASNVPPEHAGAFFERAEVVDEDLHGNFQAPPLASSTWC